MGDKLLHNLRDVLFNEPKIKNNGIKRIQYNPASAYAKSRSRLTAQQIFTTVGIGLAIVLVFTAGYLNNILIKQRSFVSANIDFNKSLTGYVQTIDAAQNKFMLRYNSSFDINIINKNTDLWQIQFPPGTTLKKSSPARPVCFTARNIQTNPTNITAVSCNTIIRKNNLVLVEYALLSDTKAEIVANRIIGKEE